jgi:hypothetical protein
MTSAVASCMELLVILAVHISALCFFNSCRLCMDTCVQYVTTWIQFKFNVPQDEQIGESHSSGHRRHRT